jgi:NAD(P)-dependent dehydrogenase (short-subunit alcohol dehydrogenase family)
MSSGAGWSSAPGFGPYNVSKVALNALCASFARELVATEPDLDAQLNVLEPGEARTEMNQGSTTSPWVVVPMTLRLLTQPRGGPTGRFFHRDGRHLAFLDALPWERVLA